ncbi:YdbL family protein [Parathalassolituus penaei]|uniref:YdbL family protein n=1 Tax=Parathalassolituus penaei TaxID=2997323 RepID=A0A9X3EK39_9GAMM|nr:YdbL family protein [Parathalassolituus penaei]MCY0965776.1 YdbL family protein [Parathalassolituus penaei]
MKALLIAITALLVSVGCQALDLDQAREQGLVGEKPDGYVGLVVTSNKEAAALVVTINQQRKQHYQEIANKQNTALGNIERIAGEKLVTKAMGEGIYYQDTSGSWNRK